MLLAIEFPDAEGDAAAGKRTLVVRLGPAGAARLWRLVLALGVLALLLAALAGLPIRPAVAMSIFVLPAMAWFWWRLGQEAWAEQRWWGWLGFLSIALLMGAAMVELIAFLSLCLLRVPAS
jgi:1,4-dihydroxy-2-naphthoate octaprenyltransferase